MQNKVKYLDFTKDYKVRKKNYVSAFDRVMKSGNYVLGDEVSKFETEFSHFLGTKYCVGVGNGLESLQISLMVLGIGGGDEVITTPLSAVASTLAILAVGAIPVFVDIKENGQIDENLIESVITKNTKAILPVHLYGQPCEIIEIKSICKKYNLYLVEDACQAHGTVYRDKKAGSFGDLGCFSFYPTKNLGAIGDGGAIVTNNSNYYSLAKQIRDYGQESKYRHIRYGLNSRLDEFQAAILREKLKYLERDNKYRKELAERYIQNIDKLEDLQIILPENIRNSNYHLFVIKTKYRNELQDYLKKMGIPSLVHYPISIPDQPMFDGKYKNVKFPVVRKFVNEILSLPCHPFMKISDVDYICSVVKKFFT